MKGKGESRAVKGNGVGIGGVIDHDVATVAPPSSLYEHSFSLSRNLLPTFTCQMSVTILEPPSEESSFDYLSEANDPFVFKCSASATSTKHS